MIAVGAWGKGPSSLLCFTVYNGILFTYVLWGIGIVISFNTEEETDALRSCVIQGDTI